MPKAKNKRQKSLKFISPVAIIIPRKTKKDRRISLNLNVYRNLNHFINNQTKTIYNNQMESQLRGIVLTSPIQITFRYYKGTKRRSDKANTLSIVEKFFCDALVHFACIKDDNDEFIKDTHYLSTIYDKNNARVEIEIQEL